MTLPTRVRLASSVLRLSAAIAALMVVGSVGALALVDTRSASARAADWAATEAATGTLPTSVADVALLPEAYRRATFLKMTPAQRSALWVEQYSILENDPSLSQDQRAVISGYKALIEPDLYDKTSPRRAALQAATNEYCGKIQALFSEDQRWRLRNIGKKDTSSDSRLVRLARFLQNSLGIASVSADDIPDCRCAEGVGACNCTPGSGELCKDKACTNIELNCGCGTPAVDCDLLCELPVNN